MYCRRSKEGKPCPSRETLLRDAVTPSGFKTLRPAPQMASPDCFFATYSESYTRTYGVDYKPPSNQTVPIGIFTTLKSANTFARERLDDGWGSNGGYELRELQPEKQGNGYESDSDYQEPDRGECFSVTKSPDGLVKVDGIKESWGGFYTLDVERVKVMGEGDERWVYVVLDVEHQFREPKEGFLGDKTNERLGMLGRLKGPNCFSGSI